MTPRQRYDLSDDKSKKARGKSGCSFSEYSLGKMVLLVLVHDRTKIGYLLSRDDLKDLRKSFLIGSNLMNQKHQWMRGEATDQDREQFFKKVILICDWLRARASEFLGNLPHDRKGKGLAGIAEHLQCAWFANLAEMDSKLVISGSRQGIKIRFHSEWHRDSLLCDADALLAHNISQRDLITKAKIAFEKDCEQVHQIGKDLDLLKPGLPQMQDLHKTRYQPSARNVWKVVNEPGSSQWSDALKVAHMLPMPHYDPAIDWANEVEGYNNVYTMKDDVLKAFLDFAKSSDVIEYFDQHGKWHSGRSSRIRLGLVVGFKLCQAPLRTRMK